MNCETLQDSVLDAPPGAALEPAAAEHAAACEACGRFLEDELTISEAFSDEFPPSRVKRNLLVEFDRLHPEPSGWSWLPFRPGYAMAAAGLLAVLWGVGTRRTVTAGHAGVITASVFSDSALDRDLWSELR